MSMNNFSITQFIGIGFMVLAGLNIVGGAEMNDKTFFVFSLAGFLLVLFDISHVMDPEKKVKFNIKAMRWLCLFLAIMSIIVFPYVEVSLTPEEISKYTNSMMLTALGFAVVSIGYRDAVKTEKSFSELKQELALYKETLTTKHENTEVLKCSVKTEKRQQSAGSETLDEEQPTEEADGDRARTGREPEPDTQVEVPGQVGRDPGEATEGRPAGEPKRSGKLRRTRRPRRKQQGIKSRHVQQVPPTRS